MKRAATLTPDQRTAGFTQLVRPRPPFAFAFAISSADRPVATIMPEETFGVEIADGKLSPHDHDDWFTSRIPVMPAASGPVHVVGAKRGDILEVEILGLTPDAPSLFAPVLITVAVTAHVAELGRVMVQAAAPCGALVRLPALQSGGMLTFGPCTPSSRGLSCSGVSAQAIIRCSVFNTLDH